MLDFQQRAAVISEYANILVVAGAGSGKTRVLVERIAHLIEKKRVSPFEILCVTFTRKAASEMKARLVERIGDKAHRLNIGTLHSLALSYIRMFGDELGIRPGSATVYGEWEEQFLLRDTAKLVKAQRGYVEMFERFYQGGIEPGEHDAHRRLFEVFMHRLKRNNSLTYGMLLAGMLKILPTIAKRPIRHILVDEAQDLDLLQWTILRSLQGMRPRCSLYAVGDIDQSIYSFRGAVPEYLLQIQESFKLYRLENNYRSATAIVSAANRLIEHNQRRIPKTMLAHREEPGRLYVKKEMDSASVAGLIKSLLEKESNIAVLSRTHVLLIKLSQELEAISVPHNYCGRKTTIIRSEEFRRVHAIFKLKHNGFDEFSFSIARPLIGVTDEQYMAILTSSTADQESCLETYLRHHASDQWKSFFEKKTDGMPELVSSLATISSGLDESMALKIARGFVDAGGKSLTEYLDYITTWDVQEEVEERQESGVQLMTIHAAKGLEFPVVIIIGMNDGILPSKQSIDGGDIEEERRLAYVAMTRAEDKFFIAVRPETSSSGTRTYANPESRFVKEAIG